MMKHYSYLLALVILTARISAAAPLTQPAVEQKTADLAEQWKPRLSEAHLRVVVAAPFVIAGDGSPTQLATYRDNTILAAMRDLEAQFFEHAPTEPILILLFESEKPYTRLSRRWFGETNVPHYGYYRHHDRVMVMNVATGTGTLVHELTHALIAPDFPKVPGWFNEGLASLYEQSQLGPNSIRGLVNWRLPGLQNAIRAKTLRPLQALIEDSRFYREDLVGINYAQARYLMLYLQEKGLLQRYYKSFRDHAADDPNGLKTLEQVIGPKSLDDFEQEWRQWVMTLRFE